MTVPALKILGVYRPEISTETWQQQLESLGSEESTREHFAKLVLIEAIVEGLDEPFEMSRFGQMQPEHPGDAKYMQVGYDEALLSVDGETLIQREMDCIRGTGPLRFAAYLHFYDPGQPIEWQCGEVIGPPIQDIPVRLSLLMPYTPCD